MRWRRLDLRGSDECRLTTTGRGWRLAGLARYADPAGAARLRYEVGCDPAWRTVHAEVRGAAGGRPVALAVRRRTGFRGDMARWTVDGTPAPWLDGLVDLDLGFTPATNLFPLRRLALAVGEAADAEAAWLDDATWTLRRLPQRYERRGPGSWWYESPTTGYAALLAVSPAGFVLDYPGLWRAER